MTPCPFPWSRPEVPSKMNVFPSQFLTASVLVLSTVIRFIVDLLPLPTG